MASKLLTKTRYLNGLQCPKLLWVACNNHGRLPETDTVTQHVFDQGNQVGELAKQVFPGGIEIPDGNFMGNIRQTRELMDARRPLFEAGIMADRLYSRVDILVPVEDGSWDIVEVKSTTSVKDNHLEDVAFQKYCCQQTGLDIRKCYLMHLNNRYIRCGDIDVTGLFTNEEITEGVNEAGRGISERIDSALETIGSIQCPEVVIGGQCSDPYPCGLTECWDFLPEHNVFTLYRGGKKSLDLLQNGILAINEIPGDYPLTRVQKLQTKCVTDNASHLDHVAITDFLDRLEYPLCFMDFETFSPAVPLFDGMRPYQRIPFQFSVHRVHQKGGLPEHDSFLAAGTDDPRLEFIKRLIAALGESGSVVVYNQAFEKGVLKELAEAFPKHSAWVDSVSGRMVDLLEPFRSFHYYNPTQKGSASLKSVLPAVTGYSYEDMEISNGELASVLYQSATFGNIPDEERDKIYDDLEKYCGLDTEGMIEIVNELTKLATD
ncbi:DUF2779 domain-containing protein [Chloroflexota bacterium]